MFHFCNSSLYKQDLYRNIGQNFKFVNKQHFCRLVPVVNYAIQDLRFLVYIMIYSVWS